MTVAQKPDKPVHKDGQAKKLKSDMPETVRYLVWVWTFAVAGEAIHQILTIVAALVDPAALRASAKEAAKDNEMVTDSVLNLSVYLSIAFMASITLVIIGILVWMLVVFAKRQKWAGYARRLLFLFSIFFSIRLLTVFLTTTGGSSVPVALILVDGIIQIAVGVAAACGMYFASQQEALKWTGEDQDPRFNSFNGTSEKKSDKDQTDKPGKSS
ncbi:hypothetical protein QP027_01055 [Corynebacterium breve]|uniref:DUF2975 domain-containing protein n=1 Tax=Corynebacterium breve TaxID=3049799 RepID=A0ABY8VEC9_9CORY|nr:hypothetical protein [Corynebacterium breve]WIM68019.1 hypothetical protein QP027_01055 [Corynebacterium breve]